MARPPKPTKLLEMEKGKLYGEQKERAENEPQPLIIIEPLCPHYFRPSERDAWNFLSEILKNYSLYLDINSPLLELASIYLADVRNSHWEITRRGKGLSFDAIKERDKSVELLIKILNGLNISASGIAKLGSAVVKGKKEKDEFFED